MHLSQYALNDVGKADEFDLFYIMSPTQTIIPEQINDHEKRKQNMKFLLCENADGIEKVYILIFANV